MYRERKYVLFRATILICLLIGVLISCKTESKSTLESNKAFNDLELRNFGRVVAKNVRERKFNDLFRKISVEPIMKNLNLEYGLRYLEREDITHEFSGEFRIGRYMTDFTTEDGTFHFVEHFTKEGADYLRFRAYQNFIFDIIDLKLDVDGDSIMVVDGYSYLLDKSFRDYIKEMVFDNWGRDRFGDYSAERMIWAKELMAQEVRVRNNMAVGNFNVARNVLNEIEESEKYRGYMRKTEIAILPYLDQADQLALIRKFKARSTNELSTTIYESLYTIAATDHEKLLTSYRRLEKQLPNDPTLGTLRALSEYKLSNYYNSYQICDSVLMEHTDFSEMRLLRLLAAQNIGIELSDTLNNMQLDAYDLNDMSEHDFMLAMTLDNNL